MTRWTPSVVDLPQPLGSNLASDLFAVSRRCAVAAFRALHFLANRVVSFFASDSARSRPRIGAASGAPRWVAHPV